MRRRSNILELKRPYGRKRLKLIPEGAHLPFEAGQNNISQLAWSTVLSLTVIVAFLCLFWPFDKWGEGDFARSLIIGAMLGALVQIMVSAGQIAITRWRFTPTEVSCRSWRPLRRRQWQEALSAYQGILRRTHLLDDIRGPIPHYELILRHRSDDHRSVMLYRSKSHRESTQRQKSYARLFGLPALMESIEGISARKVEELDKSLAERLAEPTLAVGLRDYAPPKDVAVDVTDTSVFMVFKRGYPGMNAVAYAGVFFLLASLAIVMAVAAEDVRIALLAGTPLMLVGMAFIAAPFFFRERVLVSPRTLEVEKGYPWNISRHKGVETSSIRDVIVAQASLPIISRGAGPTAVQVITENEVIVFGRKLKKESKNWVRDCIIAVIGKGGNQGEGSA